MNVSREIDRSRFPLYNNEQGFSTCWVCFAIASLTDDNAAYGDLDRQNDQIISEQCLTFLMEDLMKPFFQGLHDAFREKKS